MTKNIYIFLLAIILQSCSDDDIAPAILFFPIDSEEEILMSDTVFVSYDKLTVNHRSVVSLFGFSNHFFKITDARRFISKYLTSN